MELLLKSFTSLENFYNQSSLNTTQKDLIWSMLLDEKLLLKYWKEDGEYEFINKILRTNHQNKSGVIITMILAKDLSPHLLSQEVLQQYIHNANAINLIEYEKLKKLVEKSECLYFKVLTLSIKANDIFNDVMMEIFKDVLISERNHAGLYKYLSKSYDVKNYLADLLFHLTKYKEIHQLKSLSGLYVSEFSFIDLLDSFQYGPKLLDVFENHFGKFPREIIEMLMNEQITFPGDGIFEIDYLFTLVKRCCEDDRGFDTSIIEQIIYSDYLFEHIKNGENKYDFLFLYMLNNMPFDSSCIFVDYAAFLYSMSDEVIERTRELQHKKMNSFSSKVKDLTFRFR